MSRTEADLPVRLCFVCLGNICRSPTAEATMARHVATAGLTHVIEVDSAGTGGWHVGDPPDPRALEAGAARDLAMAHLRGRQFHRDDFDRFELVLAMDLDNMADLRRMAPHPEATERVRLLRTFDPAADPHDPLGLDHAVPDPYYGGADGFDLVLDLVDAACAGLLEHLRATYDLR